jgi:hypothetical protein
MWKNSKNREYFIDEFRKQVPNGKGGYDYFLYESGKWVKIKLPTN